MKTFREQQLYSKDFYRNIFIRFKFDTNLLVTNCTILSCETKLIKVAFPFVFE